MNKISSNTLLLAIFVLLVISLSIFATLGNSKDSYNSNLPYTAEAESEEKADKEPKATIPKEPLLHNYIEIINACGPSLVGECVNMRSGPSVTTEVVARLRNGIVLPVLETVTKEGRVWYKIKIETAVGFPERIQSDWYVASGDYVHFFKDEGTQELTTANKISTTKKIIVDLSEQMLYAYDNETLFMKTKVSTGLKETRTPRGTFTIFRKTPSRYMQGPLEGVSEQYYDLPGVPWDLYFTKEGAVIHGAYWHDHFGEPWSHGCVNLSTPDAKKLYMWAITGMSVTVQD